MRLVIGVLLVISLVLMAAGCHGAWPEDPALYGAHLEVRGGLTDSPELRTKVRATLEVSAWYWGTAPQRIAGWRILLQDFPVWCEGHGGMAGCADSTNHTVTALVFSGCPEHSALLHEFGHVVVGMGHSDPRFHDSAALDAAWDLLRAACADPNPFCWNIEGHPGTW